ncbi:MAG: hypothetical protein HKM89_13620 [Gemmatimonadales bacterium]|nr:hypothetical protein [Gemmatimonadales bacterium]
MHRRSWILVFMLLLAGSACGGSRAETPGPDDNPVLVVVTNNYALAMEISVIGAGTTHRLGTVDPGTSGRFTVPPGMIGGGPLEFRANPPPRANERVQAQSGRILVAPGAIVDFVITPRLFNSTATLRP